MNMRTPARTKRHPRGTTLIEAIIAMGVALIGLTGLSLTQILVAKTNAYSQRVRQGSALAADLEENVRRWAYTDPRLQNGIAVTSFADTAITDRWDMGTSATTPTTSQATFAEQATDPNAVTSSATGAPMVVAIWRCVERGSSAAAPRR
jgi:Tfp pilus assembly protein PilV